MDEKQEILQTYGDMERAGFMLHLSGSISRRTQDDFFYFAGNEMRGTPLDVNAIRKVRIKRPEGRLSIHAMIYRNREDIGAIALTRQCCASALGVIGRDTLPAVNEAGERVKIRIAPFTIPGSDAQRSHIYRIVGKDASFLVTANEGVYILGESCEDLLTKARMLEGFAASYLRELCSTDVAFGVVHGFDSIKTEGGIIYSERDTPARVKLIHERIYADNPRARAVVHNVSEAAKTVSRLGIQPDLIYDDMVGLSTLQRTLFGYDDGVYCFGNDPEDAGFVADSAERALVAQIAAVRSGSLYSISKRDARRMKRMV